MSKVALFCMLTATVAASFSACQKNEAQPGSNAESGATSEADAPAAPNASATTALPEGSGVTAEEAATDCERLRTMYTTHFEKEETLFRWSHPSWVHPHLKKRRDVSWCQVRVNSIGKLLKDTRAAKRTLHAEEHRKWAAKATKLLEDRMALVKKLCASFDKPLETAEEKAERERKQAKQRYVVAGGGPEFRSEEWEIIDQLQSADGKEGYIMPPIYDCAED